MGKNDRLRERSAGRRNQLRKLEEAELKMPAKDDWKCNSPNSASHGECSGSKLTKKSGPRRLYDFDLYEHIEALSSKRASERESALCSLVQAFERKFLHAQVENRIITMLYQCLNLIKRGKTKEVSLASRVIGLLSITAGCGSNGHEIMEESISCLSEALKYNYDSLIKSNIVGCMAVVTFVAADNLEEIDRVMRIIWDSLDPKATSKKPLAAGLLASAMLAWSFLLSALNKWRINSSYWRESLSFLSDLLDGKDCSVHIAAGEAVGLINEIDRFDKFYGVGGDSSECQVLNGNKDRVGDNSLEILKEKILNQIRNLSKPAPTKGSSVKDLSDQHDLFQHLLTFIEKKEFDKIIVKIPNSSCSLKISSWGQLIQFNFFKRYLGRSAFDKQLQMNKFFEDIFYYNKKERESVILKEERLFTLTTDLVNHKERTQSLQKDRMWAQEWNQGHFAVGHEDDY